MANAGRPSNDGVIYGLTDKDGNVFYVGKTVNFNKRMSSYRAGRCHGNRALADKLADHGVIPVVLRGQCDDLASAEFEEIAARAGLVNLITSRSQTLRYAKSGKPWVRPGVVTPSTAYMRHMKNSFGRTCGWMKEAFRKQSDQERVEAERRIATIFAHTPIGAACRRWMEAMDASA